MEELLIKTLELTEKEAPHKVLRFQIIYERLSEAVVVENACGGRIICQRVSEGKSLCNEAVPTEPPNCDSFGATSSKPGFSLPVRKVKSLSFLFFYLHPFMASFVVAV